jgi:hypothetical protein
VLSILLQLISIHVILSSVFVVNTLLLCKSATPKQIGPVGDDCDILDGILIDTCCIYCGAEHMRGNLNHLSTCKEAYQLWPSLVTPGTKLRPPKRKTICGMKETVDTKQETERQETDQSTHVCKAPRLSCSPRPRPLMPLGEIGLNAQTSNDEKSTSCERSLWICLCCSKKHCSYESGVTVFTEEVGDCKEWDPCEMARSEWGTNIQPAFDDLQKEISDCVKGIMHSKFFFASNKYIGSPSLDLKIKRWILWRLHLSPEILTKNWVPLRRAVKETIRYKRQSCVSRMRETFIGKCSL